MQADLIEQRDGESGSGFWEASISSLGGLFASSNHLRNQSRTEAPGMAARRCCSFRRVAKPRAAPAALSVLTPSSRQSVSRCSRAVSGWCRLVFQMRSEGDAAFAVEVRRPCEAMAS